MQQLPILTHTHRKTGTACIEIKEPLNEQVTHIIYIAFLRIYNLLSRNCGPDRFLFVDKTGDCNRNKREWADTNIGRGGLRLIYIFI